MRKLAAILLLSLSLPIQVAATSTFHLSPFTSHLSSAHWEVSLGGEYTVTAYSFSSPYNTWGTGLQATRWNEPFGLKFDVGLTPQSICGNRIGAAFMIRTPITSRLAADIGIGVASYSKPSYRTLDPNNVFISTPVVCLFDLGIVACLDRGSTLGLRLLHSSNGNMRRPNRGLNYLRLEMGFPLTSSSPITHHSSLNTHPLRPHHSSLITHHWFDLMLAPSLTFSHHNMQHGLFFCYDVALSYEYRHTPVWGYGATIDLWYNYSHPWQLPRYHDTYTFPLYVSARAFVEHFWGPISIKGGIGVVLAASTRVLVPYYERLGIYYNFGNNYAGIGINAHGGQAEFIEWSFGHRVALTKRR